jgi:hypothetical protein
MFMPAGFKSVTDLMGDAVRVAVTQYLDIADTVAAIGKT